VALYKFSNAEMFWGSSSQKAKRPAKKEEGERMHGNGKDQEWQRRWDGKGTKVHIRKNHTTH